MSMNFASEPKRRVLDHLKRGGATSTQSVAQALDVSNVAARQHLADLAAMGLVNTATAAPEGKGRPAVMWQLTALAHDLFPDRHDALTLDLIESVRSTLGEDGLQRVIEARTARQLKSLRAVLSPEATLRDRLEALAQQRTSEGYMAEVQDVGNGSLLLLEHHCPICDAAQSCQAFCSTELELFTDALGPDAVVQREEHLLSGDLRCVYRVRPRAISE
jgi:predicted ArsR family transcriptional regulator